MSEQNGYVRWKQLVTHSLTMVGIMIAVFGSLFGFFVSQLEQVEDEADKVPRVQQRLDSIDSRLVDIEDKIDAACFNNFNGSK